MSGRGKGRGESDAPKPRRGRQDSGAGDPCDLEFEIELSGLQAAPLATLSVGSILDIRIVTVGNFESVAACLRSAGRDVVGTLAAFEGLTDLIECLKAGNVYEARVIRLDRGSCKVLVRRAV